jgi:hypothetical protein
MPFLDSEAQFPYGGVRRTGMAQHFEQYNIALDLLPDSMVDGDAPSYEGDPG